MSLPAGIPGKNLALLTGFLLICIFIANIGFLRTAASSVWQFIWGGISAFLKWVTSLGTTSPSAPPPTEYVPEVQTMHPIEIEEEGSGIFVTIYGVFWGIVCVLFFLLAYGVAREGKNGGVLRRLSDALRRLMRTRQVLEYEDDVEQAEILEEGHGAEAKVLGYAGRPEPGAVRLPGPDPLQIRGGLDARHHPRRAGKAAEPGDPAAAYGYLQPGALRPG